MFSFCCSNKTVISCDQLFCCHNNAYNIITISKLLYQRNQNTKSDKDIMECSDTPGGVFDPIFYCGN